MKKRITRYYLLSYAPKILFLCLHVKYDICTGVVRLSTWDGGGTVNDRQNEQIIYIM